MSERNKTFATIDPGQIRIWTTQYYRNNVLVNTSQYSNNQYYREFGSEKSRLRFERWNEPLQDINAELSRRHLKTTDMDDLKAALQLRVQYWSQRWPHMLKKCYARENFRLYSEKQSTRDVAVNSLQPPDGPPITVLYGDGEFPPGGKSRRYVPVKWFRDACKRVYEVKVVNEFRTSSVCPDCDCQLYKVAQRFNDKLYSFQGLNWCPSDECRSKPLKHHDKVGCANQYRRYKGRGPPIMERNSTEPWNAQPTHYILFHNGQKPPKSLRRKHNRN